jgi:hypothetical protein
LEEEIPLVDPYGTSPGCFWAWAIEYLEYF